MEQTKKKRGENWSAEEKEILRQLIAKSAHILETKITNTNANLLKAKEWKKITIKLNELCGKKRSDGDIKLAWKRMKLAAKANLSAHRQEQYRTGGGEKPKSPSPEDQMIMDIAPYDFVIETNDYDSDAVHIMVTDENDKKAILPKATTSSKIIEKQTIVQENPEPIPEIEYESDVVHTVVTDENHATIMIPETWSLPENITSTEVEKKRSMKENPQFIPEIAEDVPEHPRVIPSRTTSRRNRKGTQNNRLSERLQQTIAESNVEFKKKQLQMLEEEHNYKIQIYKLELRKLELEIAILEKKNCNTKE